METFREFAKDFDLALLLTDTDFSEGGPHIVYANEKFVEMVGYKLEEFLGQPPSFFHGPKTNQIETKQIIERLKAGKSFEGARLCYGKGGVELLKNWKIEQVVLDGKNYILCQQKDLSICLIDALDKIKSLQRSVLSKMPEYENVPDSRKFISGADAERPDSSYIRCHRKSNVG